MMEKKSDERSEAAAKKQIAIAIIAQCDEDLCNDACKASGDQNEAAQTSAKSTKLRVPNGNINLFRKQKQKNSTSKI